MSKYEYPKAPKTTYYISPDPFDDKYNSEPKENPEPQPTKFCPFRTRTETVDTGTLVVAFRPCIVEECAMWSKANKCCGLRSWGHDK